MREIKFRAFNDGRFTYSDDTDVYLKDCNRELWLIYDFEANCYPREREFGESIGKAEQFTGLKDINGKDIYEGDIIALATDNDSVVIATIVFSVGSFWINSTALDNFTHTTVDDMMQISRIFSEHSDCNIDEYLDIVEVIGNIHQNPELLETK